STERSRSWATVARGFVGIAAGVLALAWPGVTALVLIWFIATWAIITGALEIAAGIRLRQVVSGEGLMGLIGALSVLLGVYVFAYPLVGAVGLAWALGLYAFVAGVVLVALGIRLRSHRAITA